MLNLVISDFAHTPTPLPPPTTHHYLAHTYHLPPSTHQVVFEKLTEKHLPDLYTLLKHKLKILEMISLGWFLTLFLSVIDSTAAVNIIDCFFVNGVKVRVKINSGGEFCKD